MNRQAPSLKDNGLIPDYKVTGDIALQKQKTLRRLVGVLGMLLPILLYGTLLVDSKFTRVLASISHYYFTRASGIFVICVSLLAIFLLIYKGEALVDYILSSLAGIAALVVVLFPTNNLFNLMNGKYNAVNVTILKEGVARSQFHYVCAAVFLLSLAIMSFFLFTKSDQPGSKRKRKKVFRNRIYRFCAIIMVMALLVILFGYLKIIPPADYDSYELTFWMEVIAIEAFGFSWLVKGGVLFQDD